MRPTVENRFITVLVTIVLVSLIGGCVLMFYGVINLQPTVSNVISRSALQQAPFVDSIAVPTDTLAQLSMRIAQLEKENRALHDDLDRTIDDLRQETNNMINKLNGWLGFWIGVAAIICIILPIIVQLTNLRQERELFNKETQDLKDKLTHDINHQAGGIRHLAAEVETKMSESLRRIKEKEEMQENRERIWRLQHQIDNGIDSELMNPVRGIASNLHQSSWNELTDSFRELIDVNLSARPFTMKNIHQLQMLLLDMSGYIGRLNRGMTRHRNRNISQITDTIHALFNRLDSFQYTSPDDFREPFNKLLAQFRAIRERVEENPAGNNSNR